MSKPEIIKLCDFREIPIPDKLLEVKVPRSDFDSALERVAKRYLDISQTDGPVHKGDIVIADLQSADPAWQREGEHINVGLGFAEPALEEALAGMRAGEEKAVDIRGTSVTVCVTSIRRLAVPALTDGHVKALGLEGIETVDAYKDHLLAERAFREETNRVDVIVTYVIKQVIASSEFRIPEEALEEVYQKELENARGRMNAGEDTPEEKYLPEYARRLTRKEIESVEQAREALREEALFMLKFQALNEYYIAKNHVVFNEETYQEYIQIFVRRYHVSSDSMLSYDSYIKDAANSYLSIVYLPPFFEGRVKTVVAE